MKAQIKNTKHKRTRAQLKILSDVWIKNIERKPHYSFAPNYIYHSDKG